MYPACALSCRKRRSKQILITYFSLFNFSFLNCIRNNFFARSLFCLISSVPSFIVSLSNLFACFDPMRHSLSMASNFSFRIHCLYSLNSLIVHLTSPSSVNKPVNKKFEKFESIFEKKKVEIKLSIITYPYQ